MGSVANNLTCEVSINVNDIKINHLISKDNHTHVSVSEGQ